MHEKNTQDTPHRSIKAVERVFDMVETLDAMNGARLTELANELDLPNSTVHTYLQTLVETGYVDRNGDVYTPSIRFLKHGGSARRNMRLHKVCRRQLDEVAKQTTEVATLGIEHRGKRVLINKSMGDDAVYDDPPIGEYTRMHWTALGKALLAHLPTDQVDEIIETYGLPESTENTITERSELLQELEQIRDEGFSIENEERRKGVRSIAVPLTGASEEVLGALSITGPRIRLDDQWLETEAKTVLRDAKSVIEVQYIHG